MKRLLVITVLVLSSGPAYGEWVFVERTNTANMIAYVDMSTVHRDGNLVKMWHLVDYQTARRTKGGMVLSVKTDTEYDCAGKRLRMRALTGFLGRMGKGETVFHTADTGQWQPVEPESVGYALWEVACKKAMMNLVKR